MSPRRTAYVSPSEAKLLELLALGRITLEQVSNYIIDRHIEELKR